MDTAEKSSRSTVLEDVLDSLDSIRAAQLPPARWEGFERAVAAILAALDRDDVMAVKRERMVIDGLDTRQQNVAGPGRDAPVRQPARARSAADNLSRRIREELADEDREQRR